ncbi:MFS transporter [Burkholderia sp. MR1-5-21]
MTHVSQSASGNAMHPPPRTTSIVLLLCFFAIVAEGYDAAVMGAIVPALIHYQPWHLDAMQIGAMGSAALFGTLFGCYFIGVLSDLAGRKPLLIGCVALFSLSMLAAATAPTPWFFSVARFIGGLGLGGVISVAAALTVEYSPPERKNLNFALMYSGYFCGALLSALVAMGFLDELGWRFVVMVGAMPLLALPALIVWLPESISFLCARGRIDDAKRLATRLGIAADTVRAAPRAADARQPLRDVLREVFSRGNLRATLAFWVAQVAAVMVIYGLGTWLPQIMRQLGYNLGSSLSFLAVFMLGSAIGGIGVGRLADRFGPRRTLVVAYLFGAACLAALSVKGPLAATYVLVACAGLGSGGVAMVQLGLIANFYAPHARASATGWAAGIGRFGAMAGPLVGGFIVRQGVDVKWNFFVFAAAAVCAGIAILMVPRRDAARMPASQGSSATAPLSTH